MICPNCSKLINKGEAICPHCGKSISQEVTQDWKAHIEQVMLGYEQYKPGKGLVHGLQKDAIQNGWGHRLSKKGKDWAFEFNLFRAWKSKYVLTMTDIGGYGLTGKNYETQEIPDNLPERERLGRFEHMYFSGGSTQAAGLYGRGKLLFTAASKDNYIIYDSLTHDGLYRLNRRILRGRILENFAKAFEGESAKEMLKELTDGTIDPLNKSGTRIIIVDPRDEIINAILDRTFLQYIEESWWQIILKFRKFGSKICVKSEKGTQLADVPKEVRDMPKNAREKWKAKVIPNLYIDYNGTRLKIKKCHFIVAPDPVPAETRGVYLYRREMKVADLGLKEIPKEIVDRFYGYVEIESNSEFEKIYLAEKVEGPEHYSIIKKGVIRKLRNTLQLEFDKFKTEIGLGVSSIKIIKEKTRRAMLETLNELNERMGKLGVSSGKMAIHRNFRVTLENIVFPSGRNVVNIGDQIKEVEFKVQNRSEKRYRTNITVFTKELRGKIIETFYKESVTLDKDEVKTIGPFSLEISSKKYPFVREIYCSCVVKESSTNKVLAKKNIPIFIGIEPPPQTEPIIEVVLASAIFPKGPSNRRVDYKEVIKDIKYVVTNATGEDIKIRFKARIIDARTKEEIDRLHLKDFNLKSFAEKEIQCPDLVVAQEKYNILDREKGPVILRTTVVALEPSKNKTFDKGDKLRKLDLKFWVNMDSGKGVFEDYIGWDGGTSEPRSKIQSEGQSYVCLLNTTHPAYISADENGDDSRNNYMYEQLLRQTLILLFKADKTKDWPEVEGKGKKYRNIIEDSESDPYEKIESYLATMDYLYADYLK